MLKIYTYIPYSIPILRTYTSLFVLGPNHALVCEAILHRELRVKVRLLLPLHSPHRPTYTRPRRQDIHKVSIEPSRYLM